MSTAMTEITVKPFPGREDGATVKAIGKLNNDSVPIFVHGNVIDEILDYSDKDLSREIGGFLLGRTFKSDDQGKLYVEVTQFLPAPGARGGSASLTFTHDVWSQANHEIETRFPDLRIVGWHHTHPSMGVFLSGYDTFIHKNFFSEPWQIAIVVDPNSREFAFFQWQGDEVKDCGFVCVQEV